MTQPLPPQFRQTYKFRHKGPLPPNAVSRIKAELRTKGAVAYNMWLPETHFLPRIIHENEHIMGTVYGRYKGGRGVLVATTQRVIFLDKKPGWMRCDELTFAVIGGVIWNKIGPIGTVTLRTRLGDYSLRTFNQKNAAHFVDYIELKCLQEESNNWGVL